MKSLALDAQKTIDNPSIIGSEYPALQTIIDSILKIWPEHSQYIAKRFADNDEGFLVRCDELSGLALKLVGEDLVAYCKSYRWMCENFIEEDLYFQRHKQYRMSSFAEVNEKIYSNPSYMSRYVQGILLSQIFWDNHARAMDLFRTRFLPSLNPGSRYLEVGPGHGLFLYFAACMSSLESLTAHDVSSSSISATREALSKLGVSREVNLVLQDIMKCNDSGERYDAIVISEVLEHLENPVEAMRNLYSLLKPGGSIYMNVPVNSPAPDHIYLWRSSESFFKDVTDVGFDIDQSFLLPVTGCSLERAIKFNSSISCVVIARKGTK